jgi:hypothetical protein
MTTELKIRHLVNELAKDIVEVDDLLKHLDITREDYLKISNTRGFREALSVAEREWKSADNVSKRVKLKAAAITEELLLTVFYTARDGQDGLTSKVKALETIAKIGGLGALEPSQAMQSGAFGNTFNLQINYSDGASDSIKLGAAVPAIEVDYSESNDDPSPYDPISAVFENDEVEAL